MLHLVSNTFAILHSFHKMRILSDVTKKIKNAITFFVTKPSYSYYTLSKKTDYRSLYLQKSIEYY